MHFRYPSALLLALANVACASSDYMHPARAPLPLSAPPDRAHVVFVRPSSMASSMLFTVLDGRGRFLGDALPGAYFVAAVAPGDHLFIGWAENTAALRASVAPGRTYYVHVAPRMGFFSSRVQLFAVKPATEKWQELPEWIRDSEPMLVDEPAGQAYLRERHGDVLERIASATELWAEYDAEELLDRTLRPEHGTLPGQLRLLPASSPLLAGGALGVALGGDRLGAFHGAGVAGVASGGSL